MTTNDHGKKISEVWVPGEGDAYNHRYQSKDGLELELSATHHGDHDEFWIVLKRDGMETGRINPRQVTEISWENANVDLPPRTSPQNKQDAYGG